MHASPTSDSEILEPERAIIPVRSRLVHLELIRIIAIILVVFNHTGTMGFLLYSVTDNPVTYPLYLFLSILSKIGVPLFFMVSGALLIARDESTRTLYCRRVVRIVFVILAFSLVQYFYSLHLSGEAFSLSFFAEVRSTRRRPSGGPTGSSTPTWPYWSCCLSCGAWHGVWRTRSILYLVLLEIVWVGVWPILRYLFDLEAPNLALPLVSLNIFFFTWATSWSTGFPTGSTSGSTSISASVSASG